jgi:hypothetical protein
MSFYDLISLLCCRHWLFGERIQHDGIQKRERGWFPRPCVVELVEGASYKEYDKNKWYKCWKWSRRKHVNSTEELIEAVAGMPCDGLAILYVFSKELHLLSCFLVLSEYIGKLLICCLWECFRYTRQMVFCRYLMLSYMVWNWETTVQLIMFLMC